MDYKIGKTSSTLLVEVPTEGAMLTVIAEKVSSQEWSLAVRNEHGVSSHWYEYFTTAQKAIEVGVCAIKVEGAHVFTDISGFEYLIEGETS